MLTPPDSNAVRQERWYLVLSLLVILFVGLLSYSNAFNVPFVFDDIANIVDNPCIMIDSITIKCLAHILKGQSSNRPLADATLAVNYFLHQQRVFGYHVVNLLIHILTAVMVFLIARRIMCRHKTGNGFAPLGAALLWMTNPVHTQSVTYIVQRMTSLATFFYLLSLYSYIRARQNRPAGGGRAIPIRWYLACLAAMFLGFVSKETTALLPLFILGYEWYFVKDLDVSRPKQQAGWIFAATLVFMTAAIIYTRGDPVGEILSTYAIKPFTPLQRLLTESKVIIYYISLLVFPHPVRLNLDYDFPLSTSLFDPVTAVAVTALAGLAFAAVYSARRHRLFSFAVLWFLGNLAIESSLMGLEIIYEHRTYLPSVFPVIALIHGLYRLRINRSAKIILVLVPVLIGCIWTFQRNTVRQSDIGLWLDCAAKAPANPRPFSHLGLITARSGRNFSRAVQYLETALKLSRARWGDHHPMTAVHQYNLGEVYRVAGDAIAADKHYRQALALIRSDNSLALPAMAAIYNNLAGMKEAAGDFDGAIAEYNQALAALPAKPERADQVVNVAGIHNNLGVAFAAKGDYDKAEEHFKAALAIIQEAFGAGHPYSRRIEKALQQLTIKRNTIAPSTSTVNKGPEFHQQ